MTEPTEVEVNALADALQRSQYDSDVRFNNIWPNVARYVLTHYVSRAEHRGVACQYCSDGHPEIAYTAALCPVCAERRKNANRDAILTTITTDMPEPIWDDKLRDLVAAMMWAIASERGDRTASFLSADHFMDRRAERKRGGK